METPTIYGKDGDVLRSATIICSKYDGHQITYLPKLRQAILINYRNYASWNS